MNRKLEAILISCISCLQIVAASPADTKASEPTRAVLSYLAQLPKQKDNRIISGQFPEWYPRATLDSFKELQTTTGETPGVLALDYFETFLDDDAATQPTTNKPPRWREINPLFVEHWRSGGLVTLSVHMTNPWSGKKAWDKDGNLAELVAEGLPTASLRAILDPISEGLADLQKQGVVVIFRPYHEFTGGFFWWGGKKPEDFKNLWQATFRYYTEVKKLHNLLWVFNPHSQNGEKVMDSYPGSEFVDIVGIDIYSTDLASQVKTYEILKATGKPFTIPEYGPGNVKFTASTFANTTMDYDYGNFAELILRSFPETVYFVTWRGPFSLNKNRNAKQLLNHPLVANLKDLADEPLLKPVHREP